MRRPLPLLIALLLPTGALAMGDLTGEGAVTRIPEPALDYRVRVTDTEMNQFEVVKASFQGHIHLSGTVGKARVSVPFDKIAKVIFEPMESVTTVDGSTPCFGLADFGNVSIRLLDLRDAEFLGRVHASKPDPAPPEDPSGAPPAE